MNNALLAVQQTIVLSDIGHMACRAAHGVHQPGVGIHPDVRQHREVSLVALFARMHLGVALAVFVFCRTGRGNERRVHCAAFLEQQALRAEQVVDAGEHFTDQFVFLQPVAKPQNGALLKQAPMGIERCKLAG